MSRSSYYVIIATKAGESTWACDKRPTRSEGKITFINNGCSYTVDESEAKIVREE